MKKIFTHSFLFVVFLAFFISCSKDVKAPAKVTNNTTLTMPSAGTQTTNQNQGGHTCGGGDHTNYNGGSH